MPLQLATDSPAMPPYDPAAHGPVHDALLIAAVPPYRPCGHATHADAPANEYCPAGHGTAVALGEPASQ